MALERLAVLVDRHFALEEDRLLPLLTRLPADTWSAFAQGWLGELADCATGTGTDAVVPFLLEATHPTHQRSAPFSHPKNH